MKIVLIPMSAGAPILTNRRSPKPVLYFQSIQPDSGLGGRFGAGIPERICIPGIDEPDKFLVTSLKKGIVSKIKDLIWA